MPFVSHDPRSGKGGARPGAGRPTKQAALEKKQAAAHARELLEAEVGPILTEYIRLAKGGKVKKGSSPQTIRHAVERFVPAAKVSMDVNLKGGFEKLIQDLEREEQREREERAIGTNR